jgi:hypothetical protein
MGYSAVEESWAPSYDSSPLFKIEGTKPLANHGRRKGCFGVTFL